MGFLKLKNSSHEELVIELRSVAAAQDVFTTSTTYRSSEAEASLPFESTHVLPFPLEGADFDLRPLAQAVRGSRIGQRFEASTDVQVVGAFLFDTLFGSNLERLYNNLASRAAEERRCRAGIRLVFSNPSGNAAFKRIASLPWEAMYDARRKDFVALLPNMSIFRSLPADPNQRPSPPPPSTELTNILVITTDTKEGSFESQRELRQIIKASGKRTITSLINPSSRTVIEALRTTDASVVHFVGHVSVGDPYWILLPAVDGGPIDTLVPVSLTGKAFVDALRDHPSVRFVYLDACNSAQIGAELLSVVPAAVCVQGTIGVGPSIEFATQFYETLAHGAPLHVAMSNARESVDRVFPGGGDWALPSLYTNEPAPDLASTEAPIEIVTTFIDKPIDGEEAPEVRALQTKLRVAEINIKTLSALIKNAPHPHLDNQIKAEKETLGSIQAALSQLGVTSKV